MGLECGSKFKTGRKVIIEESGRDMEEKKRCTAIVLSAGQGKRMGGPVQKQYIELNGKPVIYYSLMAFQKSEIIDDIILVVGREQLEYVRQEIVEKYHIAKVDTIVAGGKERYDSVWQGLKVLADTEDGLAGYVFIHDGARPFVDENILIRGYEMAEKYGACVAGMPSKDTVKLVDEDTFARETPERKYVWTIQTPQIFEVPLIVEAYSRLMRENYMMSREVLQKENYIHVTDDAMVVEQMMQVPVKLFEGSYENIKITTPEDLEIAQTFLDRKWN